jgi:hypothetical protein
VVRLETSSVSRSFSSSSSSSKRRKKIEEEDENDDEEENKNGELAHAGLFAVSTIFFMCFLRDLAGPP